MAELVPQLEFGHYILQRKLGAGGIGEVWKALDQRLGRVVALKFISKVREGSTAGQELFKEARAASVLNHPNIVTVLDIGESDQGSYLAMEFVDGESLRARLERGAMLPEEALGIFRQVAAALAEAHKHGIIHRDLKPENIMLRVDGYVKLVDFGLAKVMPWASTEASEDSPTVDPMQAPSATETGALVGTFHYMSPEQARGKPLAPSSDIFSLGIVMHESLAGEHPFREETTLDTLQAILNKEPEHVSSRNPAIPLGLDDTVSKSLKKLPSERYPSGIDLKFKLDELAEKPALLAATHGVREKPKWMKAVGAAILTIAVAAVVWIGIGTQTGTGVRTGMKNTLVQSVAIRHFNAGEDQQETMLAQSLSDDLSGELTKAGLNVPSSARMNSLAADADPQTIGNRLQVDAILEGNVRHIGSKMRVRVELISTANGFQLWSETYTVDAEDPLAAEDTVIKQVTGKLRELSNPQK